MTTRTQNHRQRKFSAAIHLWTLPTSGFLLAITSAILFALIAILPPAVMAQQVVVTTKKGLQHEGELFTIEKYSVGYKALSPYGSGNLIVVVDDGLRRVFIGQTSVATANGESQRNEIEFEVAQKEYNGSEGTAGQLVRLGPFNEFGHRDFFIRDGKNNRRRYVQGITKITPRYCIVNVLTSGANLKQWRMAVATSMIDPEILRALLVRQADPNNVNDMFDIADFFRQTQNYEMARKELLLIQNRFPEEKERVEEERIELTQIEGRQILADIDKRLKLGQSRLAATFAQVADNDEFSNDMRAKFDALKQVPDQQQTVLAETKQQIEELIAKVDNLTPEQKIVVDWFSKSLQTELTETSFPRLSGYTRVADDNSIPNIQKLALAMSGWILGSSNAIENMAVVESLYPVKSLVLEYLADETTDARRTSILAELAELETGNPTYIDSLLQQSTPVAAEDLSQYDGSQPIEFFITVPGTVANPKTKRYRCLAHLPTEYDPHRKYPAIISLPGGNQPLEQNLNLWCGSYNENLSQEIGSSVRNGQASREGLIVLSVDYRNKGQQAYRYSTREHFIVNEGLREALRRFAIDSDRVFLSGHFEGGSAAYDIAVSHPEQWAGVLGFSGTFDKYVDYYSGNRHVGLPMYAVTGEKDVPSKRGIEKAASKWLKSKLNRFINLTVVEYKGQLGTDFREEIPHAIKWMKAQKRTWPDGPGFEFEARAMRPGDSYFWFFEMDDIPDSKIYEPELIDLQPFPKILTMSGNIKRKNLFRIEPTNTSLGRESTLWLGPDFVDFSERIEVQGRGSFKGIVKPANKTLLDDVLRRGDVQHAYWGKLKLLRGTWSQVE